VREGVFREDLFHRLNVIRLRLPPLRERREDIAGLTRFFLAKSAKELGVEAKRISDEALVRLAAFEFPGNVRQLENICHWLTVMAPAQLVQAKDLPPELHESVPAVPPAASSPPVGGLVAAAPSAEAPPAPPAWAAPLAEPALPSAAAAHLPPAAADWLDDLQREARRLLDGGEPQVWDTLTRQFEGRLIHTALDITRGRRIEAAQKLGIGRNTITRKIQELGLDD
jgi:two-component system nitrogen regulation response regulator GlnG